MPTPPILTNISTQNIGSATVSFCFTTDQLVSPLLELGLTTGEYPIKSNCKDGEGSQTADFGGLAPNTTYYFIIKVSNANGTTTSTESSFTTLPL